MLLAQDLVEFENGKVANADDINANFNTLIDAIDDRVLIGLCCLRAKMHLILPSVRWVYLPRYN